MIPIKNDSNRLIINADDFAQSEAVDAAIIDLAERQVINATSALVLSPRWQQSAEKLIALPIQVGLHLDLTSDFTRQFGCHYTLSNLIYKAYSRQLDKQLLQKMIELQWDKFTKACGRSPDFIDGHQHVHQLPVISDALFAVIIKKGWHLQQHHWLRSCDTKYWRGYKAQIISTLGAKCFLQKARALGINTNSDFAGVYNFNENTNLHILWENWLNTLHQNYPVIMCHVAMPNQSGEKAALDQAAYDSIYGARLNEYRWLSSDQFQALMKEKGYSLKATTL